MKRNYILRIFPVLALFWLLPSPTGNTAPASLENLYQEGLFKETGSGDLKGAISVYRTIVEQHGENREVAAKAQLRLGVCFQTLGEKNRAAQAFQRVISRFPDQVAQVNEARAFLLSSQRQPPQKNNQNREELWKALFLGESAYRSGKYRLCVNSMKKVLILQPEDRDTELRARQLLARSYLSLGEKEKADREERLLWEMGEKKKLPRASFSQIYYLSQISRQNPSLRKKFVAPYLLGLTAFKTGDYDGTIQNLTRALRAADEVPPPLLYQAYVVLGWARERRSQKEEAQQAYREALRLFYRTRSGLFRALNPYVFLAREPKFTNSDAWKEYRRADELLGLNKYSQAIPSLKKARVLSEHFPALRVYLTYLLGLADYRSGLEEKARERLTELTGLLPALSGVYPDLTTALKKIITPNLYGNIVAGELLRQGEMDLESDRLQPARTNLELALHQPCSPGLEAWIHLFLARVYREENQPKKEEAELKRARQLASSPEAKKDDLLRQVLDRAREADIYQSPAWEHYQKGKTSFRGEDYNLADREFSRGLKANPTRPWLEAWLRVWRGNTYLQQGLDRRRAEEKKPGNPPAALPETPDSPLFRAGSEFQGLLEWSASVPEPHSEKLQQAVQAATFPGLYVAPAYFSFLHTEHLLLEGGSPDRILMRLKKVKSPDAWFEPLLQLGTAAALWKKGDREQAEELRAAALDGFDHLDQFQRENPLLRVWIPAARYRDFFYSDNMRSYRKAALDYFENHLQEAAIGWQEVLKNTALIPSVRARALLLLGKINERWGDQPEAAACYRRVLKLKDKKVSRDLTSARREARRHLSAVATAGKNPLPKEARPKLPILSWRDAYRHYGERVRIRGTIRRVVKLPDQLYYLEFNPEGEEPQPEIQPSLAIHKPDFKKFPEKLLDGYVGKEVLATGRLDRLGCRLRLRLRDPSQIKLAASGARPTPNPIRKAGAAGSASR